MPTYPTTFARVLIAINNVLNKIVNLSIVSDYFFFFSNTKLVTVRVSVFILIKFHKC